MRGGKRFFTISTALVLLVSLTPCLAQGLPPGSYKNTCIDLRVSGGVLSGKCHTGGMPGSHIATEIRIADCPGRDIINQNGRFACGPPTDKTPQPPDGPYKRTCDSFLIQRSGPNHYFMTARCQSKSGVKISHIALPCIGLIINDNGKLVCHKF